MSKMLSLSRAARMAGVSRAEIQQRVREKDAKTFEGKLSMEVLRELYPHLELEADPVLDRIQKIKAEARPKSRYSDGLLPDQETLLARLKDYHRALLHARSALNTSEVLVRDTLEELKRSANASGPLLRTSLNESLAILRKLLHRLQVTDDTVITRVIREPLPTTAFTKVSILPSGHEFRLEGNDSILEAGLKAGFYLDYGCTSHNCGKCKCRLVSGSVYKMHNHDYFLSAREREEGYILACCYTADSNLVIEAGEAGVEEDLPQQEIRAIVRRTWFEGKGLALLHVQTPRSQTLRFKSGQQVEITTENGSVANLYIASCPCDGRNLQFLVAREPGNPLSDLVFGHGATKQTVMLRGPNGRFVLRKESTSAVLFLAKEKGFSPIKSLVEQAINIDHAKRLHLITLDTYPTRSSLDNLCRAWNDSLENFFYTPAAVQTRVEGLVEQMSVALSRTPRTDVYIAGPTDWLDALTAAARSNGLETDNWHCQPVD